MKLKLINQELGFSTSQWSNYEQGISYPKFLDLIKIAKYFNVSETDLIHGDLEKDSFLLKNTYLTNIEYDSVLETIKNQNKLIQIQEEKIAELEKNICLLKQANRNVNG